MNNGQKTNTTAMITKWDAEAYGTKNNNDIWKWVKEKRAEYAGWFVPSRGEWSAFGNAFGIVAYNGYNNGMKNYYWTSSQHDSASAWSTDYSTGGITYGWADQDKKYLRLSATF